MLQYIAVQGSFSDLTVGRMYILRYVVRGRVSESGRSIIF